MWTKKFDSIAFLVLNGAGVLPSVHITSIASYSYIIYIMSDKIKYFLKIYEMATGSS